MKGFALFLGAAALFAASPVVAGNAFDVDYGQNDNKHYHHHANKRGGGAWIGNNRSHVGGPHGGHWGGGHGQFSPRGQGGYHWGW
ncbi:hypothetical protein [Methylocystis parvus]|uniref:Sulfur globule protein n=1 Tax=Methylocystis parvus TaxID=134 RepID=A0A6B8MAN1_9HYPH|nr:hypothetical protein [Methylocystis parvus]QGM98343.1 hypothetical protein F7D14_13215 [Methylocystis parvus]WBK01329.1 hypothetical protein MMG94_06360 [Methylocystis parvus OBBP]